MTPLFVKASVAAGADTGWFLTDGHTNFSIKAGVGAHVIWLRDSATGIEELSEEYKGRAKGTIIATAYQAKVQNTGAAAIDVEANAT